MPYICLKRSDVPSGSLQVQDLWPSKIGYRPGLDPTPQGPRHISQPFTETCVLLASSSTRTFARAYSGLAAYILANVQKAGDGGAALTPAEANTIAAAIIAAMRAGSDLTLSAINTLLVATGGAGTELTSAGGSISTGTVRDILRILSGATYTVPGGTVVQTSGGVFNPQSSASSWNSSNFDFDRYQDILSTDNSLYLSAARGQLATFSSSSYRYKGITGAAVVVYSDTGSVI